MLSRKNITTLQLLHWQQLSMVARRNFISLKMCKSKCSSDGRRDELKDFLFVLDVGLFLKCSSEGASKNGLDAMIMTKTIRAAYYTLASS